MKRDNALTISPLRLEPASEGPGVVSEEWQEEAFARLIDTRLNPEQEARILQPPRIFPKQDAVLAAHWHPEFIPLELIQRRIDTMFPNRRHELIIPTQHNVLMSMNGYAGVEIDCYSSGFNRKVQLLAHFSASRVHQASVLNAMLEHTRKYRASQLFEFIDSILNPSWEERASRAAAKTGATEELVGFVREHVRDLKELIDRHEAKIPTDALKNKLIRNYFEMLRAKFPAKQINHAQIFLQTVKMLVKANFELSYFYRTEEIIEEVRAHGGGVVIPHPEQFWPILLANYDVDGIEVWNPQSQEYTEFLIHVVNEQNAARRSHERPLLIFMGDDTHFGEKVLDPMYQDEEKAGRELGVQPAWDDLSIRKSIIVAKVDRPAVIRDYRQRLL